MKTPDSFVSYIDSVVRNVRWRKARKSIRQELESHMLDQLEAYLNSGIEQEQAEALTIRSMGDSGEVGRQFDEVYRPRMDWRLLILATAISIAGLFACFAPGSIKVIQDGFSLFASRPVAAMMYSPISVIVSLTVGYALLTAVYFTDYRYLTKAAMVIIAGLAVMTAVFMVVSKSPVSPVYFLRNTPTLFPLLFSAVLMRAKDRGGRGAAAVFAALTMQLACCMILQSYSGILVCGIPSFILLGAAVALGWFGDKRELQWVSLGAMLTLYGLGFIFLKGFVSADGMENSADAMNAVRYVLSRSAIIGRGETIVLSEFDRYYAVISTYTDHILTRMICNYGWVSLAPVLLLYGLFFVHGFRLCLRQNSTYARLVTLSAMLTLLVQTVFYFTNDLGFTCLPVSLPFFSRANILAVINLFLLGSVLSVNRTGSLACDRIRPLTA